MLIPLGDDNRDRVTKPVLTWTFIAINFFVFIALQGTGNTVNGLRFTYAFSTIPQEIVTGRDVVTEDRLVQDGRGNAYRFPGLQVTPIPVYLTLITSMFMHGGWMHLLGNMLYLFIFGDNLEDRMGRARYLLFYLGTGILAGLAHVFSTQLLGSAGMITPTLGASGAISGVLGGYIVLFPRRRVRVLLLRIFMQVPAYVAVGVWFAFQLLNGLTQGITGGGVAYGAHIGGFLAGVILVKVFAATPPSAGR